MTSSSWPAAIWPCATATFASGTSLSQEGLDFAEILDARHDIEGLAAAIALAQQRLADEQRVERRDEGADRQPVDRGRRDQRQFAHAGERELQRARDRRRRERQHVDLGAQLLQPLLVVDAEMLLLVDDEQAEILELIALPSSAWVPTTMSTVPVGKPSFASSSRPRARSARPGRC